MAVPTAVAMAVALAVAMAVARAVRIVLQYLRSFCWSTKKIERGSSSKVEWNCGKYEGSIEMF